MTTATVFSRGRAVRPRQRTRRPLWILLGQIGVWILSIGVWQLVSMVPGYITLIGSPWGTAQQLGAWLVTSDFWAQTADTLIGTILGFLLGVAIACAAVLVTWPFDRVRRFLAPFLAIANTIPRIALAPLFILWFGLGTASTVFFVVSIIFLIVYLNIFSGLSSIDPVYRENARVLGASKLWLARTVYVPAVTGWLMTSLRLAIIWSILGATLAEYLAGSQGLGGYLAQGTVTGNPDMLLGAGVFIAFISILADRLLLELEKRFAKWRIF